MATISSGKPVQKRWTLSKRFNWNYFLLDNVTGSRGLMIWVAFLALVTTAVAVSQLISAPFLTLIVLLIWLAMVLGVVIGELYSVHNVFTRWLKENMLNSVANTLITLLLALVVTQAIAGFFIWGVTNATFSPEMTHPDFRTHDGANWGVLWGARKLLLTGLLKPEHTWRVLLATGMVLVLWLSSFVTSRSSLKERLRPLAQITNVLWVAAPFLAYIFLAGLDYSAPFINIWTLIGGTAVVLGIMGILWLFKVITLSPVSLALWIAGWPLAYIAWRFIAQTGIFPPINVDDWGGLLLTVIFAIFVNILSLPIGIMLALGRRAEVTGIPNWIIWPIAAVAAVYFFATSTPDLWATSRNGIERLVALWPALILIAAYYFHRSFEGNFVKAFSILFIEIIRGVPLITLLFMAIVMAPFFLPEDSVGIKSFWAVIVGYTIFSSAYMAELVRGGLQAIPNGQYEASDALGLNTLQKYRFIVLPQALRILIPPLTGSVIGTFKSSSLVALVGLIDLVGITRGIIANEKWLGLRTELYVFMFLLYFFVSSIVSAYSRRLEERTGLGVR